MERMFSKRALNLADAYALQPEELAFADLVAAGWDTADAYLMTQELKKSWSPNSIIREGRAMAARVSIKKRITELKSGKFSEDASVANAKAASTRRTESDEDVMKALSKENMLKDLYMARKKMTVGSKDWLDTNKMIADITRMKQEEVKTEDNTVHFFLPLTCEHCSLYLAEKERKVEDL